MSGVKVIWTVDAQKAKEFLESYTPASDTLLVQINWGAKGGLYYIPVEVQRRIFNQMGKDKYLKLPKPGTNPRGVEISKEGLQRMIIDRDTQSIEIIWKKSKVAYDPYKRWVDYWRED